MIPAEDRLKSPLVRGYLVQNRRMNLLVRAVDALLGMATLAAKRDFPVGRPKSVLLADAAHMGDVLVATSVLPLLKRNMPEVRIGFLIGSWARPILDGNPLVDSLHIVDHWYHNRSGKSPWAKLLRYARTRAAALKEIRARKYDVAIDLYFHLGNNIVLIRQAGIPVRIGYTSGGFGPLLTHPVAWTYSEIHVSAYQAALLKPLPMEPASAGMGVLAYAMDAPAPTGAADGDGRYLVVHMGTGLELKEWPAPRWRELAEWLAGKGYGLRFTGVGEREGRNADLAMRDLPRCVNLCNRLSWPEFLRTLQGASAVLCIDSLAAHLASAFGRPVLALSNGITNPHHWHPLSPTAKVLSHPVPCAPCFRSRGCEGMECIRSLPAETVIAAFEAMGVMP